MEYVEVTGLFKFERATKNMVRYHAGPEDGQPLMGTVYVNKSDHGSPQPAPVIQVTVKVPVTAAQKAPIALPSS